VGKASEEIEIEASLAEVWDLYFEPKTWQSWVDEFRGVDKNEGYPEVGGHLIWHSGPNGRGKVSEDVLEHEPRRLHRIHFTDPESEGELTTTFEIKGEGVKVKLDLVYGLFSPGVLGPLTDRFFIRPQQQISLRRTLERLKAEAESEEDLPR
jgi:hypothetical protein